MEIEEIGGMKFSVLSAAVSVRIPITATLDSNVNGQTWPGDIAIDQVWCKRTCMHKCLWYECDNLVTVLFGMENVYTTTGIYVDTLQTDLEL